MKTTRKVIENNPSQYNIEKENLYQRLAEIVQSMNNKEVQEEAERRFHKISKQTQSATFLKQDLQDDLVQIDGTRSLNQT